jgi:ABC-2 type transport system ATP-binding protein
MLKLENLIKDFERVRGVDTLNLEVKRREIFALLGPGGSGKTTTLRLIVGTLKPTYGRVLVDGIDLAQKPRHAKWRIGYVPDQPFFYERLTGKDFIEFHARLYQMDRERIAPQMLELSRRLGLDNVLGERIETYSRSARLKIALICALIRRPALIVLDDPLGNLDVAAGRALCEILKSHAADGAAVFIASHSPARLQGLCKRVGILHQGRLIATGSMEEFTASSHGDLEAAYLDVLKSASGAGR